MHIRDYIEVARSKLGVGRGLVLFLALKDFASLSPRPGWLLHPDGSPITFDQLHRLTQLDKRSFRDGFQDLLDAGLIVADCAQMRADCAQTSADLLQTRADLLQTRAESRVYLIPAVTENACEITGSGDPPERLRVEESREEKNKDTPPTPQGEAGVKKKAAKPKVPKGDNGFEEFWQFYPRKAKKSEARKAWATLRPDQPLKNRMGRALEALKRSEQWAKDGGRFVPYPASWLRAEGWEDVPPAPAKFNYDTMDPFDPNFPDQCEADPEGWFEDLRLSGVFPEDSTFAEWQALPLNTTWEEFRRQRAEAGAGKEAGRED